MSKSNLFFDELNYLLNLGLVGSGNKKGGASFKDDSPYVSYSLYAPIFPFVFIRALTKASNKKTVGAPIIKAAPNRYPMINSGKLWFPKKILMALLWEN